MLLSSIHVLIFLQILFYKTGYCHVKDYSLYTNEMYDYIDHQKLLINDLFRDYDPTFAPVYTKVNLTMPVGYDPSLPPRFNYSVYLFYLKLVEVQEPEEKISVIMEMAEYWYDPRLTWDPAKYGDIQMVHVRQERVWSPTLTAFGINDIADFRDQDFRLACIERNGWIYTSLSVRISSNCRMNVAMFPYDSQTCKIQFYLPIFYQRHVQMLYEIYNGILNESIWKQMGNSEWDLVNLSGRVEMLTYGDDVGDTELATFEIKIQRNPMYYIYMIIFPSFIINTLSIVGVFMRKTDKMSKLNVGLTNIMTMTFILGVMADKIPRTGYVPLLGIYIIINLVIMIVAVGITIALEEFRKCALPKLKVPEWYNFLNNSNLLVKDIFENYDPTLSPVYTKVNLSLPPGSDPKAPKPFNYTIFLFFIKLVQVQEPEEKFSVIMEMSERWHDPRLTWDPEKYDGIQEINMRQERVWSPTLTAFGINEIQDFRDQDFRSVGILNQGNVYTSLSVRVSSNCRMNVARFPFDSQTCQIQFYLPMFYQRQVKTLYEIYKGIDGNKTSWEEMGNSEWDFINLTGRVELLTYNDALGDTEFATFEIKIRRNPMYYIYMIIFPSFIINTLSIIGVFMRKTDKMSKLNVGLTNIMTMTFILGVMADKIPRTGYIPLLGIYLIINLFIMIVAVGITIALEEVRKCALPRLKSKKHKISQKMAFLLDEPLETICAIVLEVLTIINFIVMLGFWITDS